MTNKKLLVFALMITQVFAAINWFAIGSVYSAIASDLRLDVSGLGLVSSAFIAGVGLFQVPAGILTAKYGAKTVVIYGSLLVSLSSALIGFAPNLYWIALLRFIAGLGVAMIPAALMVVMARSLKGSEGLGIGLIEAAYGVGGIVGLSGWAILAELVGWRTSLITGGLINLCCIPLLFLAVPRDHATNPVDVRFSEVRGILLDRRVLIVGLALLALEIGWTANGYFMVYYLEKQLSLVPLIAGLIGGVTLLSAIGISPFIGRLNDKIGKPWTMMLILGLLSASGLVIVSFGSANSAIASSVLVGGTNSAGFTVGYIIAREVAKYKSQYEALGMNWVSTISFMGAFWVPALFSSIAISYGYPLAWLSSAILTAALILPISTLVRKRERVRI